MVNKKLVFFLIPSLLSGLVWADIHLYGRSGEFSPNADLESWQTTDYLGIGRYGSGSLVMDGGSVLNVAATTSPVYDGGLGEIYLDGDGTKLTMSGQIRIGYKGSGKVYVTNGAQIEAGTYVYIAQSANSSGYLKISGPGSKVSASSNYFIVAGTSSSGVMIIENGGVAQTYNSATVGYIGYGTGSDGWVDVIDPDSKWVLEGDLHVGRGDDGVLRIRNGALVSVGGTLYIDEYAQNRGNIYIGNGGRLALKGAAADIQGFLGLASGSDDINYWNGSGWDNIANASAGTDYTLASGSDDLAGYTVLTVNAVGWPECLYSIVGDYDGNCEVDIADMATLAAKWLFDCSYPNKVTSSDCY